MYLEIKNVSKRYGNQQALIDVSFSLKKGDIVGFLGPNGAGKTTLMKIITSILQQDSGVITINGHNTQTSKISTKRQIGYLAENNPLYKDMLVTEYLDFIASLYKIENKKDKVNEIINKTGLNGEIKKRIEELSKGYKQRVGIAAALIHDPKVLILDEPTTGLDPNQLVEIRKLIQEIGKEKIVLLSTHILQEIPKICNHIIIINKGKIVENSKMQDLIKTKNNLEEHFQKLTA
ncbi:ATP-binding cassette domain-containing protein [Flavobacteriales bacterium]|nr:ATP-binding cassette domain-containing protein [Flavobacteriales bacterium]MDC1062855.1 ATP-binding cassette domain-containing protein [Flavobacteriales bacterium]